MQSRELRLCKQTSLALKARGITSGVVVESGHGVSQLVPIFEDFIIDNCARELAHVCGAEIDSHVEKYLAQSSLLDVRADRDLPLFRDFKTRFGRIPEAAQGRRNEFARRAKEAGPRKEPKLGGKFLLKVG